MCCMAQDIEHPILSHGKESSHCCHIWTPRYTRTPRSRTSTVTSLIAESDKKSQKKRQSYIPLARGRLGDSRLRQQKSRRKESFAVDSWASMHMVSKRDRNSAELVTMRTSRRPTTVMTARSHGKCQRIWTYSWQLCFLKDLPQFFYSGSSARIMGIPTTGPAVKNHTSPKMARELIAIYQTIVPFVVPGLSTSSSTTPTLTSSSSSQDSVVDVGRYTENPVPERREKYECGSTEKPDA